MQITFSLESIAVVIILIGVLFLMMGCLMSTQNRDEKSKVQRETKAIVFIGPIPLVWGVSRRTQIILAIVALSVFMIWIIFWF